MSKKLKSTNHKQPHSLAAEYALGVLEGEELQDARAQFESNPEFRQEVADWQVRLDPMLHEFSDQQAPLSVWQGIDEKLFEASAAPNKGGLFSSLFFWRTLTFASFAFIAAFVTAAVYYPAFLGLQQNNTAQIIASLGANSDLPSFVVRTGSNNSAIEITTINLQDNPNKVAELWLIPADGTPRSLGIVANNGATGIEIDLKYSDLFKSGAILAISIEPLGGAPNGTPTGPVIATGKII